MGSTIALFSRLDVSHSLASTDRPSLHAPSTLDISTFPSSSLSWLDRLSASQLVSATIWQRTSSNYQPRNQWTDKQRAATNAWGSCSANRVPIQSEGHLFLRGQPRRCQ